MTIVAIHQPNFFPWLGYFAKVARADVFIFLDDAQFQKTGGTWSNRVKLLIGGEARWVTAPIERAYHGTKAICDIRFSNSSDWRSNLLKTLETSYRRAPCFAEAMTILGPLVLDKDILLATYNIHAVTRIAAALGFDTDKFVRSSSITTRGQSTERLIELTRAVDGNTYMCGGGASGYQDDAAFAPAGIRLHHQAFDHPIYSQTGSSQFVPGLSVIDALMNCGPRGTFELLTRDPSPC